jgi:hypothetical protein
VPQVQLALRVIQDHRALQVLKALQVQLDQRVPQVQLVLPQNTVGQDTAFDLKTPMGLGGLTQTFVVQQGLQDLKALLGRKDRKGILVRRVQLDHRAFKDLKVTKVLLAQQARLALLVQLVRLVRLAQLVHKAQRVQMVAPITTQIAVITTLSFAFGAQILTTQLVCMPARRMVT